MMILGLIPSNIYLNLLTLALIAIMVAAFILQWNLNLSNIKVKNRTESDRKVIQDISTLNELSFALYDENGHRKSIIVNGKEQDNNRILGGMLCPNLFENPFGDISAERIKSLKPDESISGKIDTYLNRYADFLVETDDQNKYKSHIFNYRLSRTSHLKYSYVITVTDITEIVENENQQSWILSKMRLASLSTNTGIALIGHDNSILFSTCEWAANLGYSADDTSTEFTKYMKPADVKEITETVKRIRDEFKNGKKSSPYIKIIKIASHLNKEKWTLVNISAYEYDKNAYSKEFTIISLNIDVTEMMEKQANLKRVQTKISKADAEIDTFMNTISHEVRTPLNSIIGFTNLYISSDDSSEQASFIPIIKQNNEVLSILLKNVTEISKYSNGTIKPEMTVTDLNVLFSEIAGDILEKPMTKKTIEDRDLYLNTIVPKEHTMLRTDPKIIKRIIGLLADNALKFTEKGGVEIGFRQEDKKIRFYVKDTGIGIKKEKQEEIFDGFVKLDTFTVGSGLGLTLCKTILKTIGSKPEVISEPGKGSTFSFVI